MNGGKFKVEKKRPKSEIEGITPPSTGGQYCTAITREQGWGWNRMVVIYSFHDHRFHWTISRESTRTGPAPVFRRMIRTPFCGWEGWIGGVNIINQLNQTRGVRQGVVQLFSAEKFRFARTGARKRFTSWTRGCAAAYRRTNDPQNPGRTQEHLPPPAF